MMTPMKRFLLCAGALLAGAVSSLRSATVIEIDPGRVLVPHFKGWGTSLCWWAHVAGHFPPKVQEEICDLVFDPQKGLGLNIVRYNIGGGENPRHPGFMEFRARIPGYQPQPGVWDWEADAGQMRILLLARQRGVTHLEAFANSPPYWMTRSGSVTGNHHGRPNLPDTHIDTFASYLADVVAGLERRFDLRFDTLTPLNEPISRWWTFGNRQEGCHIEREQQARLLERTAHFIRDKGLTAKVTGPEENAVKDTLRALDAYPAETRGMLAHIATHTYHSKGRTELRQSAASTGKPVWVSEYGDGDASGLKMARTILADLHDLRAEAWVYWQAVDSAGGWGFLRNPLRDFTTTDYVINPKFHVMAHFSRFIRQGMSLLDLQSPDALGGYDAASGRFVIVVLNDRPEAVQTVLNMDAIQGRPKRLHAFLTHGNTTLQPLKTAAMAPSPEPIILPARSIATFVLEP